jgi:hypothetical protein
MEIKFVNPEKKAKVKIKLRIKSLIEHYHMNHSESSRTMCSS